MQNDKNLEDEKQQQENDMDAQDTGEDQNAIGQADNEESESGHHGIADTKNTKNAKQPEKHEKQENRKPGETNDERTISENTAQDKKKLKTVQQMNENSNNDKTETNEYQHVKEAKECDKTTMDNGK